MGTGRIWVTGEFLANLLRLPPDMTIVQAWTRGECDITLSIEGDHPLLGDNVLLKLEYPKDEEVRIPEPTITREEVQWQ